MMKVFIKLLLIGAIMVLFATGCTSYNGIAKVGGKYYISKNVSFFGNSPSILICTAEASGNLDCTDEKLDL